MIARAPENTIEPIPAGTHLAVCSGLVDLGEQYNEQFQKYNRQVLFMWELPEITYEKDGKTHPRTISKSYTLSLAPMSRLLGMLQSWRGKSFTDEELKGFDLKNTLKKSCLISVIQNDRNGKTYSDITGVVNLPARMEACTPETIFYFDMEEPETYDVFDNLPEWVKTRIKKSETYKEKFGLGDGFQEIDTALPY